MDKGDHSILVDAWREREAELASSVNPFAVVVQAHLAAQATREASKSGSQAKIRLIRSLYVRGYEQAQVLELLRLIDWLVALPTEQEQLVERELERMEEEQKMPYVTSWERMGQAKGLLDGLAVALELKFGAAGVALLPDLQQIADPEILRRVGERIKTASSVDELRLVYDPSPGE